MTGDGKNIPFIYTCPAAWANLIPPPKRASQSSSPARMFLTQMLIEIKVELDILDR